ncbi:MAG: hypothetical protein LQ342_000057 [Letrouitia transgressa]|nr:MAG: hypothetical protein LQ342_000057 [Letrouitia transgressa]
MDITYKDGTITKLSRQPGGEKRTGGRVINLDAPPGPRPKPVKTITCAFLFTSFLVYEYFKYNRDKPLPQDIDTSFRFDRIAKRYDEDVDSTESLIGITKQRQRLIEKASGNVLEVGVGSGRNSEFYDLTKIKSLKMMDKSPKMLELAKTKWKESHPEYQQADFIAESALDALPPPNNTGREDGKGYDTIISTMSLCSTPYPSLLIRHLGLHLNSALSMSQSASLASSVAKKAGITSPKSPSDNNSRILLLEHGRSYFGLVNWLLDRYASSQALEHGCWWNRDIGKIVRDSGMEVVSLRRKNLGTTWIYELKYPEMSEKEREVFRRQYESEMEEMRTRMPAEKEASEKLWKPEMEQMVIRMRLDTWREQKRKEADERTEAAKAPKKKREPRGTIWESVK